MPRLMLSPMVPVTLERGSQWRVVLQRDGSVWIGISAPGDVPVVELTIPPDAVSDQVGRGVVSLGRALSEQGSNDVQDTEEEAANPSGEADHLRR